MATHLEIGRPEAGQAVSLRQRAQLPQPLGRRGREADLALMVIVVVVVRGEVVG
jgi:hypothetical protein